MSREVRKVSADWKHPKDSDGNFIPIHDHPYNAVEDENYEASSFRPDWSSEEMTHYQWYEDVSEGTPLSPPFTTEAELVDYIVEHGDPVYGDITRAQAEQFVKDKWAPSFIGIPGKGLIRGMQYIPENDERAS